MIKCIKRSDSRNADATHEVVIFEEVLDQFDIEAGKQPKKANYLPAKGTSKFIVGNVYPTRKIITEHFETPQYDEHKPFEKTGLYYRNKIVSK